MTAVPPRAPIRILVADDHPLVRKGLRALLESLPDLEIVGEATQGEQAVALASELLPDVVIMDLNMPGVDGIEATRRIEARSPSVGVLVLTMYEDDESVFAAMRAGARGYLMKGAEQDEVVRAINSVAGGEAIFGPSVARRILDYFRLPPPATPVFPELTVREREVLDLVAAGHPNSVIARRLFLSPKTVSNHVSNIFAKLQVADRAQAIVRARRAGLGSEDD